MKKSLRGKLVNSYLNCRSQKVSRKIFVIESDDWGSTRTNSCEDLKFLNRISDDIKNDPYTQLDNIAEEDDLTALYDVLKGWKNVHGESAKFTPNVCTANPDFQKIRDNDFNDFFYKPFYETIKEKVGNGVLSVWRQGVDEKLFSPQLHGREHLHSLAWLKELREGNHVLLSAFDCGSFGVPFVPSALRAKRRNLQAALDCYGLDGEFKFQQNWVKESAQIFEAFFGYTSNTFIAPAYVWNDKMNSVFLDSGIKALQGLKIQYQPNLAFSLNSSYKRRLHYIGQKSVEGLMYLNRNVFYEPFSNSKENWVESAWKQINLAFNKDLPVIMGTHRINYIGTLDENNRKQSLRGLGEILARVIKKWPDVVFMSTDELVRELNS